VSPFFIVAIQIKLERLQKVTPKLGIEPASPDAKPNVLSTKALLMSVILPQATSNPGPEAFSKA